ncbi:MAG TPA: helix-turn-helix domain-containing protein [Clostridia bacterium]|nr:helix-turn-helix domain-containing protein [Clostridia bacterium]
MPDNKNAPERWISLQEACEHLGVKRYSIMKWIETKDMPAAKVGRLWKFKLSEIDEWVRSGGSSE